MAARGGLLGLPWMRMSLPVLRLLLQLPLAWGTPPDGSAMYLHNGQALMQFAAVPGIRGPVAACCCHPDKPWIAAASSKVRRCFNRVRQIGCIA